MATDKQTTVRLEYDTRVRLQIACSLTNKSQRTIIEEALEEYFRNHNLGERYELTMTAKYTVLSRVGEPRAKIIDVQPRNGLSPEALVQQYREKLRAPVSLIIEESGGS